MADCRDVASFVGHGRPGQLVDGDRRFGVIDAETAKVASAKQPRYWRRLLRLRAEVEVLEHGRDPTLRHGDLPPDPGAFRIPRQHNYLPIPIEGFGSAPCLGVHAGVVRGGRVSAGDEVRLGE